MTKLLAWSEDRLDQAMARPLQEQDGRRNEERRMVNRRHQVKFGCIVMRSKKGSNTDRSQCRRGGSKFVGGVSNMYTGGQLSIPRARIEECDTLAINFVTARESSFVTPR